MHYQQLKVPALALIQTDIHTYKNAHILADVLAWLKSLVAPLQWTWCHALCAFKEEFESLKVTVSFSKSLLK